ncbi:hypothetical protein FRC10_003019 [Ceratobasidium sp. 414]|nr:hypothetical protein FRC10_003019 [Ceratobasidium sp. 414]
MATFSPEVLAFAQHMASFAMSTSGADPAARGNAPALAAPANLEAMFRVFTAATAGVGPNSNPNPRLVSKSDVEPVDSEATQRERITFKLGNKPPGTAGRGGKNGYNLQKVLKIDDPTYKLIRRVTKHSCIRIHIDMRKPYGKQPSEKLVRARDKLLKAFPEFRDFDDPYWPINAFLLVVLKSTSQTSRYALNKLKKDKEVAKKGAKKGASAPEEGAAPALAKGGKAAPTEDEDPIEALVHDTSMMSVRNDVLGDDNEDDDDEDDDDKDDEDKDDEDDDEDSDDNADGSNDKGAADKDIEMADTIAPPAPTTTPTPATSRPRPKMRPPPVPSHVATPTPTSSADRDPDPAVTSASAPAPCRKTRASSRVATAADTASPAPQRTTGTSSHTSTATRASTTTVSMPTSAPDPAPDPAPASASDPGADAIRKIVEDLDPESINCLPAFMTHSRGTGQAPPSAPLDGKTQPKPEAQAKSRAKKVEPEPEPESELTEEEPQDEPAGTKRGQGKKGGKGKEAEEKAKSKAKVGTVTATTTTKAPTKNGKAKAGGAKVKKTKKKAAGKATSKAASKKAK